jgi:DNA polymerase-3 subunit epsilon
MINESVPSVAIEQVEFSVLDVETTGLSARENHVIEIGIVKVKNLKIASKFQSFVNPGCKIPYFITQFTGITDEDIIDAPFFSELADKIENVIGDSVISAHNISFDDSFLKYEFFRTGREPLSNHKICTLKIARRLYPSLKSKSLSSITQYLRLKNSNAHRALADAEVTARALIKMIKKLKEDEGIETLDELHSYQSRVTTRGRPKIKKSLNNDVSSLPNAPGIYYFLNKKNEIIYVGKAKSLGERIKTYFSPTASKKAKKIVRQASKLKTEITNSELTALLTEAETIKLFNPKHNSQLKKYGNKYFIRINKTHNYPKLEISNHFDFDGNDYFGLFISRKRADKVMEMIDKTFTLRECTDKEFAKMKKCFLADIERCTAPCIKTKDPDYSDELEKVYEFLNGKNQTALDRLLHKMKDYSSKQKYEKAAEVKELVDLILAQTHKSSLLSEPVNSANVLFEISESLSKDYLLLISGKPFLKTYIHSKDGLFEDAIDDYFSGTLNLQIMPSEEDLEKMKISLNWLIKNRNKVRIFYLKDYTSREELYSAISRFSKFNDSPDVSFYDINHLVKGDVLVE